MEHWVFDFSGAKNLDDPQACETFILRAVALMGMTILYGPVTVCVPGPDPQKAGITSFAIINTSDISIHTWSLLGQGYVGAFSCKEFKPRLLRGLIQGTFEPERIVKRRVKREKLGQ